MKTPSTLNNVSAIILALTLGGSAAQTVVNPAQDPHSASRRLFRSKM